MFNIAVICNDISSIGFLKDVLLMDARVASVRLFNEREVYLKTILNEPIDISFIYIGKLYINSISLAKRTRIMSPNTRIVLMSETKNYANMAFDEGAWGYLIIPSTEEEVKNVIGNIAVREQRRNLQLYTKL